MKNFAGQFWVLCRPFWCGRSSVLPWLTMVLMVALGGSVIYLNVLLITWTKSFYDALTALNGSLIFSLVGEYFVYIACWMLATVYEVWFRQRLIIRWRGALTRELIDSWLAKRAFYRMSLSGRVDNPDQRIAQDIEIFVTKTIALTVDLLLTPVQLVTFVVILWQISGVQQFTLLGQQWTIHGYLVWTVLAFTVLGTLVTHWLGKRLHGLTFHKERLEGNFRAALLRKYDNAEQIAQYGGEQQEKSHLARHFQAVVANWHRLIGAQRNLSLFTSGYGRVSEIAPIFAALPLLLNKTLTFGGLMQVRSAFKQVYIPLSWIIRVYPALIELSASLQRLAQFRAEILAHQSQQAPAITGERLQVGALSFNTPQGQALLHNVTFHCEPGSWSRLSGESGLGKSTLLRTLNGLWPWYDGEWQLPEGRSLLLPQQSYLGHGTLAEILCYPHPVVQQTGYLREVLDNVGLSAWRDRLDEQHNWDRIFSGGERQRLAFARALIAQPQTLWLDEATSSLDPAAARELLALLKRELPATTVVAVTHQQELDDLFPQHYDLTGFRPA